MTFIKSRKKQTNALLSEKKLENVNRNSLNKFFWWKVFSQKIKEKKVNVNCNCSIKNSYESMCFDNYAYGDNKSYNLNSLVEEN